MKTEMKTRDGHALLYCSVIAAWGTESTRVRRNGSLMGEVRPGTWGK
jgi:hypothetical protein